MNKVELDKDKINKYDPYTLKGKIDQKYIEMLSLSYKQVNTYIDVKLIIGILATLPPIFTHFGPYKFPQNYTLGIVTTAWYFMLSLLYYFYDKTQGSGTFFMGRFDNPNLLRRKNRIIERIKLESYIDKYSHHYRLKATGAYNNGKPFLYQELTSVGNYYTSEGQLVITEVEEKAPQLLMRINNL